MKTFEIRETGQYHLDKGSDICQDWEVVKRISDDVVVLSVADGVGSEEHSEYASEAACNACVEHIVKYYDSSEDYVDLIQQSFHAAYFAVEHVSSERNIPTDKLHCTLCTIVFSKEGIYWGNVGDSGAIALQVNGDYIQITHQQNDEEGRVAPLSRIESREFGFFKGSFVSAIVATDGFYNHLFPPYLPSAVADKTLNSNKEWIDYDYLNRYIDTNAISSELSQDEYQKSIEKLIGEIPRRGFWSIDDDLTVIGVVTDATHDSNDSYVQFDRTQCIIEYQKMLKEVLYSNNATNEIESKPNDVPDNSQTEDLSAVKEIVKTTSSVLLGLKAHTAGLFASKNVYRVKRSTITIDHLICEDPISITFEINSNKIFRKYKQEYLNKVGSSLEEKIQRICAIKVKTAHTCLEWPTETVVDDENRFIGYVANNTHSTTSIREFEYDCERYDVKKAYQLSYSLFFGLVDIHSAGIQLGYIDPSSVYLDDAGKHIVIRSLDLNSVSLSDYTSNIDNDLIDKEYFVPEMITKKSKIDQNIDSYIISNYVFRLFFAGHSPYHSQNGSVQYIYDDASTQYEGIPQMNCFPENICELFRRSLSVNPVVRTPVASEWINAFNGYFDKLKKCDRLPNHKYFVGSTRCPYCDCIKVTKSDVGVDDSSRVKE